METIQEESETEDMESESTSQDYPSPQSSQNPENPSNSKTETAKLNRIKRKSILTKIKLKSKKEEPPKWICSVNGCKWGGRYKPLLISHVKTCHPDRKDVLELEPYDLISQKPENWPEPLEVRKLDVAVEHHKTAEEVEKLEAEIKKL